VFGRIRTKWLGTRRQDEIALNAPKSSSGMYRGALRMILPFLVCRHSLEELRLNPLT
jgi:hypothetical protein